ncbi:hypothetical protein [Kitasatospora sp. NPDC057541]|uniref:hypothetical protein n=1 Tax=unclassified Kitasatospora TaxID=2633591 RepID=UPI0036BBD369
MLAPAEPSTPRSSSPGGRADRGPRTGPLLAADPGHHPADSTGGTVEIVETVGGGPLRFLLRFHPSTGHRWHFACGFADRLEAAASAETA